MSLTAQLDALRDSLECKIDFVGQDLVEQRARVILWASAAVAFVLGFALQNLKVTFAIFTLGFLGCLAVTLPPLPAYNAHPVKWLDPLDEYGERKSAVVAGGSPGAIEGKKDR
ncbi:hypothetical protein RTG_00318 [Rhodotorula toruloides ATCC 204091]|uniref:Signal peptidase complex subunit 1 n=1 Tax=Rhodotorula toruloides TaxID=5286 RepID=A0A0K3CK42_RHOTO|nr:hypothetical protein RTG_00318 [Rhodotorula toruloides ATCC 204091]KAK4332575.1 Microsomal signal peptidase 12 kDa subunit (SPC12)-domain containing protein [Rhodotorula toruloides]PRQ72929.1 Microsomal signal peptidase 12 kDa subunit (SPC12)-domain containing protein [Rhodotorula toruloides]